MILPNNLYVSVNGIINRGETLKIININIVLDVMI
jgi:hypothetical protein